MSKKIKPAYPGSIPLFHELVEWQRDGNLYLAAAKSGEFSLHWAMTDEYVKSVRQGILRTYDAHPEACPVADKVSITLSGDRIIYRCSKGAELLKVGAMTKEAATKAVRDFTDLVGPQNLLPFRKKG